LECFHGIIVCVLGSKQGPPTTPLHTWIVALAAFVPFVVDLTVKNGEAVLVWLKCLYIISH
jgi:hypothetical protein